MIGVSDDEMSRVANGATARGANGARQRGVSDICTYGDTRTFLV